MGRLSTTECTYLPTYLSGGEGRKGVAHKPPKAHVGKKRKLTVG